MARQAEAAQTGAIVPMKLLVGLWSVIATLLSLFYTAFLLGPAAIASLFDEGHFCTPIFRFWAWLIFHTCGVSADIEGLENLHGLESFVLVSNHQSLFDIVAVLQLIPREIRFVA